MYMGERQCKDSGGGVRVEGQACRRSARARVRGGEGRALAGALGSAKKQAVVTAWMSESCMDRVV